VSRVLTNQRTRGGRWNVLGTWTFLAGSTGYVELLGKNGLACADAVRFEYLGPIAPTLTTPAPLQALPGVPFTHVLQAVGTAPIAFDATGLPAWLTFDGGDTLAGTPPALGAWPIHLSATNVAGADTRTVNIQASYPNIIVDNRDPNTARTSKWWVSGGRPPWGVNSRYSASRRCWFRWFPNLPVAGRYELFAWWTARRSRTTRAPYDIHHADGMDTVLRNQRSLGGQWNSLGAYRFDAGSAGYVELRGRNGLACADAVRFVYVPPVTQALVSGVSARSDGITLLLAPAHGPAPLDVEGFVLDLPAGETAEWDFGDGVTATGENIAHTFSSPGTYTVRVRVGAATAQETVTVSEQ